MRKWLGFLIGFFVLTCANGFFWWQGSTGPGVLQAKSDDSYQNTLLLTRVIELVRQDYVDSGKVGYKDLTYAALRGILSSLDPHSQFMDEDSFAEMQKETKGEFSGLGIVVGQRDGNIVIISPMEDTPGARAGILPGDRILKIDDKTTDKLTLSSAIHRLRGSKGQKVKLTLLRTTKAEKVTSKDPAKGKEKDKDKDSEKEPTGDVFEVELTRETIRVSTVKEAKILPPEIAGEDKVGYIRLEQFGENTAEEMEHALTKLEGEGMQALVLDLRNNPGGLLDAAVEVAGKFLPPNQLVVSTQGRTPQQSAEYRARGTRRHPNYPIAVLINGYSASAAEIVAGALKDLRRAVLVGETSFGKGSVQSVQDLGNGIGIRLTTAKYYTPSKKVIHEVGVTPDIVAPISETEERQLVQSRSPQTQSEEDRQALRNFHDTQLERAVGSLKGIRVFTQRQAAATPAPAPAPAPKPDAEAPAKP